MNAGAVLGADFGTTNSALALARPTGAIETVEFGDGAGAPAETRPSLLFLEPTPGRRFGSVSAYTGGAARARYLDAERGRLVQSLKSHLAVASFTSTFVYRRPYELEDLVAFILRDLRIAAEQSAGGPIVGVVFGRPVHFVGAETPQDDAFALARLAEAARRAGFPQVAFEYEPVAAAREYEGSLDRDELILIGDFGGGTSDFCLMHVGPAWRGSRRPGRILATEGLGIAGDTFDRQIVRQVVEPALGRGTEYRYGPTKLLPVPQWLYGRFEQWHQLSFLRTEENLRLIRELERASVEPAKIAGLREVVENNAGYRLYRAVEATKVALSTAPEAEFVFEESSVLLRTRVRRPEFEAWIQPALRAIRECVARLLERAAVTPGRVDRVFLTGGSSFVPAVRRLFEETFGRDRISDGDAFTSVARGLARSGLDSPGTMAALSD